MSLYQTFKSRTKIARSLAGSLPATRCLKKHDLWLITRSLRETAQNSFALAAISLGRAETEAQQEPGPHLPRWRGQRSSSSRKPNSSLSPFPSQLLRRLRGSSQLRSVGRRLLRRKSDALMCEAAKRRPEHLAGAATYTAAVTPTLRPATKASAGRRRCVHTP